jgi:aspartyl-tRNA(Asn)/glutamyl-tRNA(Gln) amidotransferase subunit A
MARTAEDAALLVEPIFVHGRNERKLMPGRGPSLRARDLKLGMPNDFFLDELDHDVRANFENALVLLGKNGAKVKHISFPRLPEAEEAGNVIAWAEASLYHQQAGWFPERSADYGKDVRERLEIGAKVTAVNYLAACEFREKFKAVFEEVLLANDLDAIVVPTTPIAAPRISEDRVEITMAGADLRPTVRLPVRGLLLRLCRPANLAGVPAISVPCGLTKSGLPIGLQFMASWTDEPLLLELAHNFERLSPAPARPPCCGAV